MVTSLIDSDRQLDPYYEFNLKVELKRDQRYKNEKYGIDVHYTSCYKTKQLDVVVSPPAFL